MNQSSVEKNGWSRQSATVVRPVAARASRTAAVVASEPFLVNLTISAVGTVCEEALRGLDLDRGRPDEVAALVQLAAHGLEDARVGVPEGHGAQPGAVLDVLVAVDVPHVGAAAVRDHRGEVLRVLVVALGVGVRTAGHSGVQAGVERSRLRQRPERHACTFVVVGSPSAP